MPEGLFSLAKLGLGKERKRRGWFRPRTGVARYLPGCILQALTWPTHKALGSIDVTVLPAELLHAIFEQLESSDHNTLSSCMRVCRRWHDIARPHFFAIVPVGYFDIDRFSQLLRTDLGVRALHVKDIGFVDEWYQGNHQWSRYSRDNRGSVNFHHPFDVRLFASTLPALGLVNLQYLSLVGFDNLNHRPPSLTPVCQSQAQGPNNPSPTISLRQLSCEECLGLTLILPSLLSLFSVDTLVIRVHPDETSTSPWDMSTIHSSRILPGSVTIQNLVFAGGGIDYTELNYFQCFARILAPGSLHTLSARVKYLYGYEPELFQFIRCDAARNLLSISIDVSDLLEITAPYLTEAFKTLGDAIAHCTRLQCFRIRCEYTVCQWNHCRHPAIFAPILANVPRVLRVFTIYVQVLEWRSWKVFLASSSKGLAYVDRMLTPPPSGVGGGETQFPHLERVELNVCEGSYEGWSRRTRKPKRIKEPSSPRPLPGLEAAGLLRLRVVHEDAVLKAISDFYLPPEME